MTQLQSADRYCVGQIGCSDSHYGIGFAAPELAKEVKLAGNGLSNAPETVIVAMK